MENSIIELVAISQNSEGYRYSVEPFLLAHWTCPTEGSRILDIGTGCGVISLLLMSRQADLEITAVEIQNSLYQSAVDNSAPLLKPGGKIALAYPFHRLEEVMNQLRKVQLNPTRFVRMFGHEEVAPKICLVEAIKGEAPQTLLEQTLTIYHPDDS